MVNNVIHNWKSFYLKKQQLIANNCNRNFQIQALWLNWLLIVPSLCSIYLWGTYNA